MNKLLLTVSAASLAVLFSSFVTPDVVCRQDKEAEDSELTSHMKIINKGYRKLRSTLRDAERNAESLEKIWEMESHALAAKSLEPDKFALTPEADRAAFMVGFRKTMTELIKAMLDLEVAVLDGDNDQAREILKNINKMKKPAHEKFKAEPDK